MMRFFDTLVGRLIFVSLLGITLVHVLSIWTYDQALERELKRMSDSHIADRILYIKRSIAAVPEVQREAVAHDLSSGPIEAHWDKIRGATAGGSGIDRWAGVLQRVQSGAPELGPDDVVAGTSGDAHRALLSLRLSDRSWVNINLFAVSHNTSAGHGTLLSTSIMAGGVVLLSLLIAGWLTRPLRAVSAAAASMSPDRPSKPISETGPREVRQLASAFNEMRTRISDLVQRRTQSLAAVSHDLRTPLTRLKLRLGEVGDDNLRRAALADVGEMEGMIESTLSYLRGRDESEPVRPLDLVSLLGTVVGEMQDAGHDVTLDAPRELVVQGRRLGLKRAVTNLVNNAVRYGTHVRIAARARDGFAIVEIVDDGEGIPGDKLDTVFEPFVRLEQSRNRESGGVGLGLTIAKANIESDGGTLELRNVSPTGLCAEIRLALTAA